MSEEGNIVRVGEEGEATGKARDSMNSQAS